MKKISFILSIVFLVACNTNDKDPFANNTYEISNYVNGKFDNKENIIFADGKISGSVCTQYGFAPSVYQVKQLTDKNYVFTALMKSKDEGELYWEGTLHPDLGIVQGKTIWQKDGQESITYNFKGEKVK